MSSFVGFLDTTASTSCVNTRTNNLIDVIRDVRLNIQGNIDDSITDAELKFLRDFYNVNLYRYVLIPNELLDTYLSDMEELSESEQTTVKTIRHTNKETGEVTEEEKECKKPLVEVKKIPDTTNGHEVYIIKNVSIKDMIATFKDPNKGGVSNLKIYVKNNRPRVVREKKDKTEKPEKTHVPGKQITKDKDGVKTTAKGKATPAKENDKKATTAKGKATPAKKTTAKGKAAQKQEPEPEPDPEEAGEEEADPEVADEEETGDDE